MSELKIGQLLAKYPFVSDYFDQNKFAVQGFEEQTFAEFLEHFSEEEQELRALDPERLRSDFALYLQQMTEFLGMEQDDAVDFITLLPGHDKSGTPEAFEEITIAKSEIVALVGATGAGKSRLLADIEWLASGDTPTERHVLINGQKPDLTRRYKSNKKLVAQLSQNMNFVMDLSVEEFLFLHAESRLVEEPQTSVARIITAANELTGEPFGKQTPITALSGGQTRALMIADTAILSAAPIVLIDEIENAGIDRNKALAVLLAEEKIVLIATHDPLLALRADRRIVISNGGITSVLVTTESEKSLLKKFTDMDSILQEARRALRAGEQL